MEKIILKRAKSSSMEDFLIQNGIEIGKEYEVEFLDDNMILLHHSNGFSIRTSLNEIEIEKIRPFIPFNPAVTSVSGTHEAVETEISPKYYDFYIHGDNKQPLAYKEKGQEIVINNASEAIETLLQVIKDQYDANDKLKKELKHSEEMIKLLKGENGHKNNDNHLWE